MKPNQPLNVRQMQAYAAVILHMFCKSNNIRSRDVDLLISHLITLLIAKDISKWEKTGASLAVTGRGDPLPESVIRTTSTDRIEGLISIIENSVEVGLSDMYGANTDIPKHFFDLCIQKAEKLGVTPPPLQPLYSYKKGDGAWGEALDPIDLYNFISDYGIVLDATL